MLSREEMIARILSLRPGLTKEEVQRMIQRKREGAGGLLTEEGAAYMVANELGVILSDGGSLRTKIGIKNIVAGANDVTITGRVIAVSPVQTFTRNNGAEGRVARIVVADETGTINVVLWDEKTNIVSQGKLTPNQDVRVFHGYVREGLNGRLELNVGRRGTVAVLSSRVDADETSTSVEFFKKICDLKEDDFSVNLMGVVRGVSPISVFERRDGKEGKVVRVGIADGTGRINVVLWDEKVDVVKEVRKNDYMKLTNGRVRRGIREGLEIHVGKFSQVTVLTEKPEGISSPSTVLTKIGELKQGMADVDVLGRVVDVGQVREFTRPSGEVGRVVDVSLMDETGSIRLSLWDSRVDVLKDISGGDTVLVEGAYTREGNLGVGLNLGMMGILTVNPDMEEARKLPISSSKATNINQLKAGLGNAIVQGTISEEPTIKTVTTRDGQEMAVASFRIRDQTGEIRVSFWRDLAEKVENLPLGATIKIKNVYVKTGFDGGLELSSRSTTEVEILSKPEDEDENIGVTKLGEVEQPRRISELKDGENAQIQGKIVELEKASRVYSACPKCKKKAQEQEGEWVCEKCGIIPQPIHQLLVNALIEDSSGRIIVLFRGPSAEKLLGMTADYAWNIATQTGDERAPIEAVGKRILGRVVSVAGRIRVDRLTGSPRLLVENIK